MAGKCIFILGGARSGKSRFAQELAGKLGHKVLFIATGEPLDEEMQARIDQHKKIRPKSWRTLEIPTNIGKRLEEEIGDAEVVIVDCLTLLISNLLGDEAATGFQDPKYFSRIKVIMTVDHQVKTGIVEREGSTFLKGGKCDPKRRESMTCVSLFRSV